MEKKGFKIFTFILFSFVFVLIFFSFVNQTEAGCSPYCCDGNDGNKHPRADTDAGETDNYDDVCKGGSSSECGGSGRYVGTPPYYPDVMNWCKQVLEHEKGYSVPVGSNYMYACNPVYKICKPDGPVCGNSKKEGTEECDPKDTSCTQDGQNGICTASCKCCVRCSVQCPSPLIVTAPVNPPHPIDEYSYLDIVSCTDETDCSEPRDHPLDCFEVPSLQPSVRLDIYPERVPTYLGFNSDTHTGGGIYKKENNVLKEDNTVNDFYPYEEARYSDTSNLFYMEATYSDTDNPIEATYVWFNKSGNKPITPSKIDLDNNEARTDDLYGTNNNESFGFMLYNKGGVWVPYIPAIQGNGNDVGDIWKNAQLNNLTEQVGESPNIKTVILIPGEAKNSIAAKVLIYSITPSNSGKTIKVKFSISFKDNSGVLLSNSPVEGNYKIWLMGNDTFGFTPYDNYEDKDQVLKTAVHNRWKTNETIRYFDQWTNKIGASAEEKFWNLNFDKPGVNLPISPNTTSPAGIDINWQFIQDTNPNDLGNEFSDLVINVYKSKDLQIGPLKVSNIINGGGTVDVNTDANGDYYLESEEETDDIRGSLINNVNHYLLKVHNGIGNGSATLTLNDVGQGKLKFYVTAFDKGGNINEKYSSELDLRDWLITQGGLLYSKSIDINVAHGAIEPTGWGNVKIGFANADLSTELIGHQGFAPDKPYREFINSYVIKGFSIDNPIVSYYTSLLERFNRKKGFLDIKELTGITTLSGNLSTKGGGVAVDEIAFLQTDGGLVVGTPATNFICDRQGVFFVDGDLTINRNIVNGIVDKDACIFVVSGNVNIMPGGQVSNSTTLAYDEINAYILSDKKIIIDKETGSRFDGLYISGGIHSLNNSPQNPVEYGVTFGRSLKVADRLRFPALVVNHHSKYGMLAGRIFGKEAIIQSTEVGLKPY